MRTFYGTTIFDMSNFCCNLEEKSYCYILTSMYKKFLRNNINVGSNK